MDGDSKGEREGREETLLKYGEAGLVTARCPWRIVLAVSIIKKRY